MTGTFWWGFWWGVLAVSLFMALIPDGGHTAARFFAQIGHTVGGLVFRASMATLNRQRQIDRETEESQ